MTKGPDVIAIAVLRELQSRDWTQKRLAKDAGISHFALCRWLSGRRPLTSTALVRVLKSLNIRVMRQEDIDAEARHLAGCFIPPRSSRPRCRPQP